jgi:hypothetical protein
MTKPSRQGHAKNSLLWFVCAILSLWLAIAASWWISSTIEYGYPLWYRVLSIDEHIARYAPHHPTKPGFASIGAGQHRQAFASIVRAVHGRGVHLEDIRYQLPHGRQVALLDDAEIRHLKDVSHLLQLAGSATLVALPLWLVAMALLSGQPLAPRRWRILTVASVLALLTLLVFVIGPKAVFYQFHVWLFPPENPWFFYWEESLMSTLMKAPQLFGAIAVQIVLLAALLLLPIHLAGVRLGRRLLRR